MGTLRKVFIEYEFIDSCQEVSYTFNIKKKEFFKIKIEKRSDRRVCRNVSYVSCLFLRLPVAEHNVSLFAPPHLSDCNKGNNTETLQSFV